MAKRVLMVVVLLSLVFTKPMTVAAVTGNGKISGVLVNKTEGGSSVADKVVSLERFQGDLTTQVKTAWTDTGGKFFFDSITTDTSYTYQVAVTFQGVEYRSDPFSFSTTSDSLTTELNVYDATLDAGRLVIMLSHAAVYFENNALLVKEYYLLINNSDRTYVGPEPAPGARRETVRFNLPAGATDVQSSFGITTAILSGSTLIDSAPIKPTGRDVSYSYRLPNSSMDYTLSWKAIYPINRFDLLLPEGSAAATGDKLKEEQPLAIAGRNYKDFSSKAVAAGDVITAKLSGIPVGSAAVSRPNSPPSPGEIANPPVTTAAPDYFNYAWLALIPVVIGAAVLLLRRKKPEAVDSANSSQERERLLAEIAELDERFQEGAMGKADYSHLRSQKKQQLMRLMR